MGARTSEIDMKNIDEQIHEILIEMMKARHEANFYLRAYTEVVNLAKSEIDAYDENYGSKIEKANDIERFEIKLDLLKARATLKALEKVSSLIKREADKSTRRDNELSEKLKQFCKRHQIDWNQYITPEEE